MNSKFIVIEGLEGAGKTTARDAIVATLRARGIHDLVFTREPGGTPLAEQLRVLVKQGIDILTRQTPTRHWCLTLKVGWWNAVRPIYSGVRARKFLRLICQRRAWMALCGEV